MNDLWTVKSWRATTCRKLGATLGEMCCQSKIQELKLKSVRMDENIFWLDVAVADLKGMMNCSDCGQKLSEYLVCQR